MKLDNIGVVSIGVKLPIVRAGDNLVEIILDSLKEFELADKSVIGITESVVARSQNNYVTLDDICADVTSQFGKNASIAVVNPIYSRNRFSLILRGIARSAAKIILVMPEFDEVGNPVGTNPFTGVNIEDYYRQICCEENCECIVNGNGKESVGNVIYCGLHNSEQKDAIKAIVEKSPYIDKSGQGKIITLADICKKNNPDFGLLGSNKAAEEKLKLFPTKAGAQKVCEDIKASIRKTRGKDVIVMVYGDGSYKDLDANIWEMADPVSSPGYTDEELLNSTPNEVKVKNLADDKFKDLSGEALSKAIENEIEANKGKNLTGSMLSQGTTPRRYINLLASLMDLTTGSGSRSTPVVVVQNYF